jgi:hypothetical protein
MVGEKRNTGQLKAARHEGTLGHEPKRGPKDKQRSVETASTDNSELSGTWRNTSDGRKRRQAFAGKDNGEP